MKKFYKIVYRYRNRLFSYASCDVDYEKFIHHQKSNKFCKEYRVGHWTRKRTPQDYYLTHCPWGLLFCFQYLTDARAWLKTQNDRSLSTEIWECEVKNPILTLWTSNGFILADAIKLTKQVKK